MMMVVLDRQWSVLFKMQAKQDEMLKKLFVGDKSVFSSQQKDDLFEIQRLNQEILKAAEEGKADIANSLRGLHLGKSKASAYQSL